MSNVPEAIGRYSSLVQAQVVGHSCGGGGIKGAGMGVQGVWRRGATEAAQHHVAIVEALVDHVLPAAAILSDLMKCVSW